jgi:O-antigen/teichoic acid export membrane protein
MNNKKIDNFTKHVITLMSGTMIAQAIPIAISPILTRLYKPEDFGLLALFLAIVVIFGSIANARYELAIMLPKKDEDAVQILFLGVFITLFITVLVFLIVVIFHDNIVKLLGNNKIGIWLYFIPIAIFFTSSFNLLKYYNNRKQFYKDIAKATAVKSFVAAIIQLLLGFVKLGAVGLITGQMISHFIANLKLLKNIYQGNISVTFTKKQLFFLANRYKNFPKFSMPATLANTLSKHLFNILISTFFSITTLGYYSLSERLLGLPSALIGGAIGQVYYQHAVKEKQEEGVIIKSFLNTLKKLFIIAITIYGILYFFVEDIFAFVFGDEWRVAGKYAQILMPLFFIRFIVVGISLTDSVLEKQYFNLIFNIILLITVLIFIYLFHSYEFTEFLKFYVIIISIIYSLYGFFLYLLSKGKFSKSFLRQKC